MNKYRYLWLVLLVASCLSSQSFAQDSNTLSKGSTQVSNGSITLGAGASELFSQAADGSAEFIVDFVEVTGEVAEVVLVSVADAGKESVVVTVSVAASTLKTLELAAGVAIEIAKVKAEKKLKDLGYLLTKQGEVLLFLAAQDSSLKLHSQKL